MTAEEQPASQDTPAPPRRRTIYGETNAMSIAYNALAELPRSAQLRAMRWLGDRLSADVADEEEPF